MKTFGEFFDSVRRRLEKTGRTDSACYWIDSYKDKHCTESARHSDGRDEGWNKIADQDLSKASLREFLQEMMKSALLNLTREVESEHFTPSHFGWRMNSTNELYRIITDEADRCGLKVDAL